MTLVAATVTVCFIGVVHFHDAKSSAPQVIVPLTAAVAKHQSIDLVPHRAAVVVKGYGGTRDTCLLEGKWGGDTPPTCIFENLSRKVIQLPTTPTTSAFNASAGFQAAPRLRGVCKGEEEDDDDIGTLKPEFEESGSGYAVRVKLTRGRLDACTNGHAWEAFLTIDNAANEFSIGTPGAAKKIVPLAGDAVIQIINAPTTGGSSDGRTHFWWYYKMYANADECDGVPRARTRGCPSGVEQCRHPGVATGPGCSVTQYP